MQRRLVLRLRQAYDVLAIVVACFFIGLSASKFLLFFSFPQSNNSNCFTINCPKSNLKSAIETVLNSRNKRSLLVKKINYFCSGTKFKSKVRIMQNLLSYFLPTQHSKFIKNYFVESGQIPPKNLKTTNRLQRLAA